MNSINDSDTIKNLEILKNKVDDLLLKAEEKINLAQKIQEKGKLLKQDLSKVQSVYNCLESVGGESSFIDLVNRIKTAEEFLNVSEKKYQNLEQHLQEELDSIKSFLAEKEAIISSINNDLESLGKKRQEVETYQVSLMKEYTIIKKLIEPILNIINSSEDSHILIDLSDKINSYQSDIEYLKKLPQEIKHNQEIYQQKVSNSIHDGMMILRKQQEKQQEKIDHKQRIQEGNLDQLNTKIEMIQRQLSRTDINVEIIYDYLKLKPWKDK